MENPDEVEVNNMPGRRKKARSNSIKPLPSNTKTKAEANESVEGSVASEDDLFKSVKVGVMIEYFHSMISLRRKI